MYISHFEMASCAQIWILYLCYMYIRIIGWTSSHSKCYNTAREMFNESDDWHLANYSITIAFLSVWIIPENCYFEICKSILYRENDFIDFFTVLHFEFSIFGLYLLLYFFPPYFNCLAFNWSAWSALFRSLDYQQEKMVRHDAKPTSVAHNRYENAAWQIVKQV